MKKAIFVYNPTAGDHSISNKLDIVLKKFQEKGIHVQPFRVMTENDDFLLNILKENKFDFAFVSGGDGTLNHVVNTMLSNKIDIPIGIIPTGTSNDFARCLNLSHDINDCIDIILAGNTIGVDVGLINEKQYFLSTCAGGLFVDVSFSTHSELKRNFGPFAYYLKALSELKNIKSFKIKIKTDKEEIEEDVLLFLVLNGKHAAGFFNLVKEADFSDGLMDIVLIKNCNHIDLAGMFFNVLSNDYLNNKNVMKLTTKSCTIKGNKQINLSVDGEKGDGLPVNISFINKAIRVFVK
jgi:diacylglycerol kinase (ATP)